MARTGRPPKPTALKVLHGDRKDRIKGGEPIPDVGEVKPSAALDAEAVAIWDQLAPDLRANGVLTPWDAAEFSLYCQAVAYAEQAQRVVNRTAVLLAGRDRRDQVVRNPALVAFRDMADLVIRLGGRFGMTPADRSALGKPGDDKALDGEHLLSGNWSG